MVCGSHVTVKLLIFSPLTGTLLVLVFGCSSLREPQMQSQ